MRAKHHSDKGHAPLLRGTAAMSLLVTGGPAAAHTVLNGYPGGFTGGLLHPLLVPAELLGVIALGLLVGQQARRHILHAVFVIAALVAIVLVSLACAEEQAGYALLIVAAASGVLLAMARALPLIVTAPLAAIGAMALIFDAVPASISMGETLLGLAGTTLMTSMLVVILSWGTGGWRQTWQKLAIRILGSWIAAIALLILALQMR